MGDQCASDEFDHWAERSLVRDLPFSECVRFLRYWSGEDAYVDADGDVASGLLDSSAAREDGAFALRLTSSGSTIDVAIVDPATFTSADFWSADGIDYFRLDMTFGEHRLSVRDTNINP